MRGYDEETLLVLENHSEVDELKVNNVTEWKQKVGDVPYFPSERWNVQCY